MTQCDLVEDIFKKLDMDGYKLIKRKPVKLKRVEKIIREFNKISQNPTYKNDGIVFARLTNCSQYRRFTNKTKEMYYDKNENEQKLYTLEQLKKWKEDNPNNVNDKFFVRVHCILLE